MYQRKPTQKPKKTECPYGKAMRIVGACRHRCDAARLFEIAQNPSQRGLAYALMRIGAREAANRFAQKRKAQITQLAGEQQ